MGVFNQDRNSGLQTLMLLKQLAGGRRQEGGGIEPPTGSALLTDVDRDVDRVTALVQGIGSIEKDPDALMNTGRALRTIYATAQEPTRSALDDSYGGDFREFVERSTGLPTPFTLSQAAAEKASPGGPLMAPEGRGSASQDGTSNKLLRLAKKARGRGAGDKVMGAAGSIIDRATDSAAKSAANIPEHVAAGFGQESDYQEYRFSRWAATDAVGGLVQRMDSILENPAFQAQYGQGEAAFLESPLYSEARADILAELRAQPGATPEAVEKAAAEIDQYRDDVIAGRDSRQTAQLKALNDARIQFATFINPSAVSGDYESMANLTRNPESFLTERQMPAYRAAMDYFIDLDADLPADMAIRHTMRWMVSKKMVEVDPKRYQQARINEHPAGMPKWALDWFALNGDMVASMDNTMGKSPDDVMVYFTNGSKMALSRAIAEQELGYWDDKSMPNPIKPLSDKVKPSSADPRGYRNWPAPNPGVK